MSARRKQNCSVVCHTCRPSLITSLGFELVVISESDNIFYCGGELRQFLVTYFIYPQDVWVRLRFSQPLKMSFTMLCLLVRILELNRTHAFAIKET